MKSIAFLSQKGGSGKTTLAVHTAVAAQEAGERVVLIDTDPQKSASVWSEARQSEAPIVATVAAGDLEKVLQAAHQDKMSLAIVDTAPDAARIARAVDLIVIPCRPTAFDLAAVSNAVEIVRAAKKNAARMPRLCSQPALSVPLRSQRRAKYSLSMGSRCALMTLPTGGPFRAPWLPGGLLRSLRKKARPQQRFEPYGFGSRSRCNEHKTDWTSRVHAKEHGYNAGYLYRRYSLIEGGRQRGKKEIVALTVRLQRAEWERLHQLAVSEGMSIQALAVRGLNRVFTEKGLLQLTEEIKQS
jgi:hypothetical protein